MTTGGRGKQRLTLGQETALEMVAQTDREYRDAKRTIEAKIRRAIEKEIEVYRKRRDKAVYVAAEELGVPKSRIAKEGMGISSTNLIYAIIDEHKAEIELELPDITEHVERFSWRLEKLANGYKTAWLLDARAFVLPHYVVPDVTEGDGWLFTYDFQKWMLIPGQEELPEGAAEWVAENPPATE